MLKFNPKMGYSQMSPCRTPNKIGVGGSAPVLIYTHISHIPYLGHGSAPSALEMGRGHL